MFYILFAILDKTSGKYLYLNGKMCQNIRSTKIQKIIVLKNVLLQKFKFQFFFHNKLVDKQLITYLCLDFRNTIYSKKQIKFRKSANDIECHATYGSLKKKNKELMVYISLPESCIRPLSFYLAMEEYIARNIDEYDCFFQWQVEPSVIFGRNQLIENEVNIEFCRENGIKMFRRKSGGGCVYADMNNIMFSYITSEESVGFTFNRYITTIIHLLRKLGVEATTSGRNDILINGKKVSGNAFYHIPGRNIVHGTMLYDTDMRNMVGSITPSDEKLMSKGIKSTRQRITLLKDYITLDINEFKEYVKKNLCERDISLTDNDVEKIKEIEKEYLSDEFIYGNNPKYTVIKRKRIEHTGDFELRMDIKNNIIKDIEILGDFLVTGDINKSIKDRLKNVKLDRGSIEEALPEKLDDVIMNLQKNDFINIIIS